MKLGQMLSASSTTTCPRSTARRWRRCRPSAPPMDFALAARRGRARAGQAARARRSPASTRSRSPSASIGQVHRAQLPTGEEVAVKIQYPGVAEAIARRSRQRRPALSHDGAALSRRSTPSRSSTSCAAASSRSSTTRARPTTSAPSPSSTRATRSSACRASSTRYSTARVLTTEFVAGAPLRRGRRARPGDARSRYGEILYRFVFGIDHPLRRLQRRSAPRQLPVRRRRARRVPRLRLREVFPDGDAAQLAGAGARRTWPATAARSRAQLVDARLHAVDGRASTPTCCSTTSATSTSRSSDDRDVHLHARVQPRRSAWSSSPRGRSRGSTRSSTCRATSCS